MDLDALDDSVEQVTKDSADQDNNGDSEVARASFSFLCQDRVRKFNRTTLKEQSLGLFLMTGLRSTIG